jgi:3-dehydroquinate dehydratase-2
MKLLILNGPNLNKLGTREPEIYGTITLAEIQKIIEDAFPSIGFRFVQSNYEGDLIDEIQNAEANGFNAIVANWAGFTHTSVAIYDALHMVSIPKVEVHISNIHAREEFREKSVTGRAMDGVITGFGVNSYVLGVEAATKMINS